MELKYQPNGRTWPTHATYESIYEQRSLFCSARFLGGDKTRCILVPADLAAALRELRTVAPASERVFPISERRINYIVKATAKRAGINLAVSAHWLRHAHASHAIDEGAPITLVSQTLGHADLKTTSVYAHARPNDSSSRYLKRT